jgi:sentrin-specific protease 7
MTAAQKRHLRVKNWTKNVNLFEKDYIIIPINEQSHWFLAIICFPHLNEPCTIDTNQPIKLQPVAKRKKKKLQLVQIGNTTITPLSKKDHQLLESINLNDDEMSERDEAEGDDSDLGADSEDSEDDPSIDRGQPVKLPCILIFDSLSGAARARVVATLRDYLTCEYRAKLPNQPIKVFNKNNMFGNCVKVPQQNNFTDCGLFLLQYVEEFYRNPIKDYRLPIKSLHNWFDQMVVTRKREDISNLIKELIRRSNPNGADDLPDIEFPTKDGKLVEDDSLDDAFGDDDYDPEEDDGIEKQDTTNMNESIVPENDASVSGSGTDETSVKQTENKTPINSTSNGNPVNSPDKKLLIMKKRPMEKNGSTDESTTNKTPKLSEC